MSCDMSHNMSCQRSNQNNNKVRVHELGMSQSGLECSSDDVNDQASKMKKMSQE